ncbi:tetraspanin-32-like isoform X2 [Narcine bancroftii]|uniref:tetraspanin-32-like isoform X2 n=1 Tax=Narcine bancroftii TaxID=1343680 RepID=UPI003831E966
MSSFLNCIQILKFLGIVVAAVIMWNSFNDTCYVIRNVTMETNQYAKIYDLAVYSGLSISTFIALLGIFCLIGILKESELLLSVMGIEKQKSAHVGNQTMFGIFSRGQAAFVEKETEVKLQALICFSVLFCGVVQLVYWKSVYKQVVEDAAKDVYDFLYADYMRNNSYPSKQDLLNIHSAFSCCGKNSTFSYYRQVENETCFPDHEPHKDCLQAIQTQIADTIAIIGVLTILLGIVTVYGIILAAFFCFTTCMIQIWNKKGKYSLGKKH